MAAKEKKQKRQLPDWGGSPAARYLILIAITVLVGISLIMAFSASSNDAVIRQVQREFAAAQSQASPTPEELIENELDYYAALEEAHKQANQGLLSSAETEGATGIVGFISLLFSSAYAAGFRHLLFAIVGAIIAFLIARSDYRKFAPFAVPVSAALLLLLVFLWLFGNPVLGSARWINFGLFSFQPSEFAKPILIVLVAYYCCWAKDADDAGPQRQKAQAALPVYQRDWVMPAFLILGCLVAIFLSPDVGTTLIIGVGLFAAYVLSGWPWMRLVAGLAAVGTLFIARLFLFGGGYQQRRVFEFITRWTEGYVPHQTWQAELALGSGGILGLGPGLSRQKFRYLPEAHNDFIIAILGEELGLIGVSLVLIAFVFILFGGLHIASRAKDRLGLAIAGSATVLIIFQALLNIFAVVSLGPVTGKPLPFVTLGGSAMISTFILIGLIFSVARYGHLDPPKVRAATSIGRTDDDWDEDFNASESSQRKGSSGKSRARALNGKKNSDRTTKGSRSSSARRAKRKSSKNRLDRTEEKDSNEDDLDLQW